MSAYTDLLEALGEDEAPKHRLLGHPDVVQGDMQLACEDLAAGLDAVLPDGTPEAQTRRRNAAAWLLLLQVDSDGPSGMGWGDVGMLYYWIRSEDLAARRFDRVWGMHQEH